MGIKAVWRKDHKLLSRLRENSNPLTKDDQARSMLLIDPHQFRWMVDIEETVRQRA